MALWKLKEGNNPSCFGRFSTHPVVGRLLSQRGMQNEEELRNFLYPDYQRDLLDPFLFSAMEKLVERVKQAKERAELVMIFGDYDADGITSSVIIQEMMDNLGINSRVYLPDKKKEGYGLNINAVEYFKKENVSLIITVDCGISSFQEIEFARKNGIDVIIVDHHHVPQKLPPANVIINPHLKNSGYPQKNLAGVGVAFKVVQALCQKIMPEKEEQLKWMLDLVAIGTIADCVPLLGENRLIVKFGLIVLAKTKRFGLLELFSVGRIAIDANNFPDARKVAFQIAPRINAAGRMNHANAAFNLIRETNRALARNLALEIEASNQNRQRVTGQVVNEVKILAENSFKNKNFIFAVSEHFPVGVVGLAAGKIADIFHKPVAIIQKGEKESVGSLRSIPQINIIEAIEKCSRFLVRYGGHEQAAGVTVRNEKLEEFYAALDAVIEEKTDGKKILSEIEIDLEIFPKDIDYGMLEGLRLMEPFGKGNEEPVFLMRGLLVEEARVLGNGDKHLKLFLKATDGTPKVFESIGFGLADKFAAVKKDDAIDAVFTLKEDNWNGGKKIQLNLIDIKINQ